MKTYDGFSPKISLKANVPISNALAAVQRLGTLGYRYRFNLLLANTHFSPGIQNDYSVGARYLGALQRVAAPSRVHFARSMAYERAVDTASLTDQGTAGRSVGLRFDQAWFVDELRPADPVAGTARVDVRTLARPSGTVTPALSVGVDTGPWLGQAASPYQEQSWSEDAAMDAPRNALEAQLSGVEHVRLDLAAMSLTVTEPLTAGITTDAVTTVTFALGAAACIDAVQDDAAPLRSVGSDRVDVTLAPGSHVVELAPCKQ